MPIVEGPTCSFEDGEYVTDAFPHDEGMLLITSGAKVSYEFEWHNYLEKPSGIPWPFLEIRKVLVDDLGAAHSCSSFIRGCTVFGSLNGRSVYSEAAFLDRFEDTDVHPLTEFAQVYCDSREMLVFQYYQDSWTEPGRFIAHFEKHTGGHVRLLEADSWIFLELRMAYFDDRISDELVELDGPVFAEITLDLWRNIHHARSAEEFRAWYSTGLVEPTFQAPLTFVRIAATGGPDPKVHLIEEPWTIGRARELIGKEIKRLVDEG